MGKLRDVKYPLQLFKWDQELLLGYNIGDELAVHFLLRRTIQLHLIGEEVHHCISIRNLLEELIRVYLNGLAPLIRLWVLGDDRLVRLCWLVHRLCGLVHRLCGLVHRLVRLRSLLFDLHDPFYINY